MKKRLLTLWLVAAGILPAAMAQEAKDNDLGTWTSLQYTQSFGGKWYAYFRGEYRTCDNVTSTQTWFVRPGVGYKPLNWLNVALSYDYTWKPAATQHRLLMDVTGTLRQGNLGCSLRERFIPYYTMQTGTWDWLLRSKLTAKYRIGESAFTPYLAYEIYSAQRWKKSHHFVGVDIALSQHSSLDCFYLFEISASNKTHLHVLGIGYGLKF